MMQAWCKRIELVLIETDLIQKESDDIGPYAELVSWKNRSTKFNFLLEQIKSSTCRNACGILKIAKSKTLEAWKVFDQKITDAANEAKDNVKILYCLLASLQPLYYSDPISIKPEIKKIMEAILMIYTTSQHYNTTDCMTHLFVKVSWETAECILRFWEIS